MRKSGTGLPGQHIIADYRELLSGGFSPSIIISDSSNFIFFRVVQNDPLKLLVE